MGNVVISEWDHLHSLHHNMVLHSAHTRSFYDEFAVLRADRSDLCPSVFEFGLFVSQLFCTEGAVVEVLGCFETDTPKLIRFVFLFAHTSKGSQGFEP